MAGNTTTHARKRKTRRKSKAGGEIAATADKYALYQEAVQDPEADVARLRRMFKSHYGHAPRSLREDFCGTGAFAAAWVAAHGQNHAVGIDLDPEPLAWGREHNLAPLRPDQQSRIHLIEGDVMTARTARVDIAVAFNFSYYLFKQRDVLLRYFRRVRSQLCDEGLFILDAYGGPESQENRKERRKVGKFTYVWDQHRFDPITHDATCYIHFKFRDGSRLRRAFGYHWRLWTLPEIRDLLTQAGFSKTTVYWEGTEADTNEPNGVFSPRKHADDDPAWVAYLAAAR